jgi:antitoxin ParD1/3/4
MTQVAIAIPEDLQKFVDHSVKSGAFTGPNELVASALYAFRDQMDLERLKLLRLRRDVQIGIDEIERGEVVENFNMETLLAELHREHEAARTSE